ncbi:hypothetical protein HDU83_001157, partial [Entophlyctis luteolus]
LHSLLLVSEKGKVAVLHKSVKDFLTSPTRCTVPDFHVSLVNANVYVAQSCLSVMNGQLRQNVFGLSSVSEPVKSKEQKLLSALSPVVRYSCLHWATHILDAAKLDAEAMPKVLSAIAIFCRSKILQWVEVMAVEKQLGSLQGICNNLLKLLESLSSAKNVSVAFEFHEWPTEC